MEIENLLFSKLFQKIYVLFETFKGQIEIDGKIFEDGKEKQNMQIVGFNRKTFQNILRNMEEKSDCSDWYFTGQLILHKDNFKEINRSKAEQSC